MEIKTVGVVGAGTMGHGIAQVFAAHGFDVRLADTSDAAVGRGLAGIESSLERLLAKEKITAADKTSTLGRIGATTDLATLAGAELVVEAVTENLVVKTELLQTLDRVCGPETILASNTSSISLTRLAAATGRPDRVIGMHFMNPVPLMELVEIIRALQTAEETYRRIHDLALRLGKTPVSVRDSPGFVSNRVLMPMINEAIFALHEGLATAEDIDTVMKLGMHHPMGPLALADLIGLDTCLSILEVLQDGFGDPKYRPCPLLRQMVDAGYLGRKTGRGFYRYD
ncbi:3-hydroxybutyryl-CoA dehydrogenase [Thioalbus denitrificans]|uniref:3-hydroxyacyl-CoA dehydrogenase n=1 Tax=Thioalbus denitrificans TaxID=547122 RepID=A0A369CE72_9GAMM|nr:3-hydroxybutyryl-CoA dehydrogenase [Thioalbus denitrificans]RCX32320.1 3-hydroxyacyl-CoA dehydrogenase [Thioalbus denitrificans]